MASMKDTPCNGPLFTMGREDFRNNDGKMFSLGAATFAVFERTYQYQYDFQGNLVQEDLVGDHRKSFSYFADEMGYEQDTVYPTPIPTAVFEHDAQGRLSRIQRKEGPYLMYDEAIFAYGPDDNPESTSYWNFLVDTTNLAMIQNYNELAYDSLVNPFFEMGENMGMPVPLYFDPGFGLKMPHLLSPHNPLQLTYFPGPQCRVVNSGAHLITFMMPTDIRNRPRFPFWIEAFRLDTDMNIDQPGRTVPQR